MFYEIFIPSVLLVLIAAIAALHHYRPKFFPGLWNTLRNAVVRLYTYLQQRWTERTSQRQQNSNVASTSHTQPADGATQLLPAATSSQQASNADPSATEQAPPRDGIELQRRPDTDISEPLPFEPPAENERVHYPHQVNRISETEVPEGPGKSATVDLNIEEWRDF